MSSVFHSKQPWLLATSRPFCRCKIPDVFPSEVNSTVSSFTHSITSVASLKRPRYHQRLFLDKMLKVAGEKKSILTAATTTTAIQESLHFLHTLPCKGRKCFNFSKPRTVRQSALDALGLGDTLISSCSKVVRHIDPGVETVRLSLIPSEKVSDGIILFSPLITT